MAKLIMDVCNAPERLSDCGFHNVLYPPFPEGPTAPPPVSPFTAEYQAIIAYATTQGYTLPSATNQTEQNQLIVDLIAAGIWVELDVFYNFATDGDANFAKINWKTPGTFQLIGALPFTPNVGFKGDNATSLSTQWIPATNAIKYTLNDASAAIAIEDDINSLGIDFSADSAPNRLRFISRHSGSNTQLGINSDIANFVGKTPDGRGFYHTKRTSTTTATIYRNGVDLVTNPPASSALPTIVLSILPVSPRTASMFSVGSSLNGKELSLYNAWNKYKSTVAARVAYKAITDYATAQLYTLPTPLVQTLQTQLIYDLMLQGIWNELDIFYNFISDGNHLFAKINWKAPGTFNADGTGHEPTFTPNVGFKGNGTTQYLKTGLILNTAPHHTSTNAGYFLSVEDLDAGAYDVGAQATGFSQVNAAGIAAQINSLGTPLTAPPAPGLILVSVSPTSKVFLNGELKASGLAAATVPNIDFYIFARNNNNTPDAFSSRRVSMFGVGSSLNGKESAFYTAWNKYKNSITSQVPYQNILDYATAQGYAKPSAQNQLQQRSFLGSLISLGVWDELDILYVFKTDGDVNFAKINWKAPGSFQAVGTGHEPQFLVSNGFKGDGLSKYLNTQWTPPISFTSNGSGFAGAVGVPEAPEKPLYGMGNVAGGSRYFYGVWSTPNSIGGDVYGIGLGGSIAAMSDVFIQIQRTSLTVCKPFNKGVVVSASNTTAVNVALVGTLPLLAFKTDNVIGATSYSANTIQIFGAGKSLVGKELSLYNAWANYKNNTTLLEFPLDIIVGTNGTEKGYATTLFGELKSYPIVNGVQLISAYTQPDDSVHVGFEAAAQLEGVDRITLEANNGEQLTLDWNGSEYVGMSAPFAAQFIVTTEIAWKMII